MELWITENPMYRPEKPIPRDRLVDPYWMEDDDFTFNACKQEMLDREEVKFWEELIEEYLKVNYIGLDLTLSALYSDEWGERRV